jgi:zinc transporter ZupT
MNRQTITWIALIFLAAVPLVAGKLRFLDVMPRSRWLSFGGGISVAYAFVRLLPELGEHQVTLEEAAGSALAFLEHHAYLAALAGVVAFYGLERSAKRSRHRRKQATSEDVTSKRMFWFSTAVFTFYNALIGYLLPQHDYVNAGGVALFTLAMALHFVVNDYGLHQHHKHFYASTGRWIISAAVLAGGAAAYILVIPPPVLAMFVAFLTGGIILNVLKEELPEERESRFAPFLAGAIGYAVLLISI